MRRRSVSFPGSEPRMRNKIVSSQGSGLRIGESSVSCPTPGPQIGRLVFAQGSDLGWHHTTRRHPWSPGHTFLSDADALARQKAHACVRARRRRARPPRTFPSLLTTLRALSLSLSPSFPLPPLLPFPRAARRSRLTFPSPPALPLPPERGCAGGLRGAPAPFPSATHRASAGSLPR